MNVYRSKVKVNPPMLISKKSERHSNAILIARACFSANSSFHLNYFSSYAILAEELSDVLAGGAGPGRRSAGRKRQKSGGTLPPGRSS